MISEVTMTQGRKRKKHCGKAAKKMKKRENMKKVSRKEFKDTMLKSDAASNY